MSGQIMNLVMLGGVVVVGYFIWINKDTLFASIGGAPAAATTGDTTTTIIEGNSSGGSVPGEVTVGCCHCKMVLDRAKCEINGDGGWWNPPITNGVSNDNDVAASANVCASTQCNRAAATNTATQAQGGGTSAKVGSEGNPGYKAPTTNKPSTGNLGSKGTTYAKGGSTTSVVKPKAGTSTATYFNANPGGYKPGGGTYYTQRVAYMTNKYRSIYPRMSV